MDRVRERAVSSKRHVHLFYAILNTVYNCRIYENIAWSLFLAKTDLSSSVSRGYHT